MKTAFILMAQYDGLAVVPVEIVCRDYFAPLTLDKFMRQAMDGKIPLPITRMSTSQKAAKGVHINDLAAYIDQQADAARKERDQLAETE